MLGASYKVKLFALGVMALGFIGHPLNHYIPILGLNWATFCNTAATILAGGGLMYAKQVDVHGGVVDTGTRPTQSATIAAEVKAAAKAGTTRPPLP